MVNGVEQFRRNRKRLYRYGYIRIRAENGETNEYIVIAEYVGINHANIDVKIMPNPANENVMIQSDCKILNINLYEINGKLIKSWRPIVTVNLLKWEILAEVFTY